MVRKILRKSNNYPWTVPACLARPITPKFNWLISVSIMSINETSGKPAYIWKIIEHDQQVSENLANELGLSLPIAAILVQQGCTTAAAAKKFLNPKLQELPSPFLMKGMAAAVSIIEQCLSQKTPVLIYGDYDVDGTTGAAVIGIFLEKIGLSVTYCQPSRFENGYGLHGELLKKIKSSHSELSGNNCLLITVDCGITDTEAVVEAKEMGFMVIITDHHQPPLLLPQADAIINPWQPQCEFPFKDLAGVGVAFYLAMGIRSYLAEKKYWKNSNPPNLREYLDMVALGTVGDLVPLKGVNRILVKAGLVELARKNRPGIKWLLQKAGLNGKQVSGEDVSFQLAPRVNAAGRMGRADMALKLLTTNSDKEAESCAEGLDLANKNRKEIEIFCLDQALIELESEVNKSASSILVAGNNWNLGILGIVASRLVRMFFRPTIVLSIENNLAKGSARSIPGINILEVLKECEPYLERFGGHKAAAGMTLKKTNIQSFKDRFEETVSGLLKGKIPVPQLDISSDLGVDFRLDTKMVGEYFSLGPFGKGNRRPIFQCSTECKLSSPRVVGSEHLKFQWQNSGQGVGIMGGIGFSFGHLADRLTRENGLIAFSLQVNSFKGREKVELFAEDIRLE